jgi:PAS domain S-box-containing protein
MGADPAPKVDGARVAEFPAQDGLASSNAKLRILLAAPRLAVARVGMIDACRRIGQVLAEELAWDFVAVWVLQSGDWSLRCTDGWVRPDSGLASFVGGIPEVRLAPETGLPGRAWATRQSQWLTPDNVTSHRPAMEGPRLILPPSATAVGLRYGLSVPVRCGEDVLAVIEVLGRTAHARDEALLEVLDTVGIQIALAELRERAEQRSDYAQKELEEARERLESIMICAPAVIATISADGKVLFLNRPWPLLRELDAVGGSWTELIEPTCHAEMAAALSKVFASGEHAFHHVAIKGENGRQRWFSNHVGPVRIGGQVAAAVVISQDITRAKVAQEELAEAQRLASVGTLAAGVAHEINTPIQFVNDSVNFLRDAAAEVLALVDQLQRLPQMMLNSPASPEVLQALREAARAVEQADLDYLRENMPAAIARSLDGLDRVSKIVRSMKEFSHPAQNEMAPADLTRAIQSTLTVSAGEYKYVADLETELGELQDVVCHVNDINQVVLNIVVNAAHAIGDRMKVHGRRGTIKVRTERQDGFVLIAISDTGGGIPEDIQARVFDPFFTTKEVGRGTGQGLAIARSIVEDKHHGTLTFESQPGIGTTFFIRLPAR